jgi:hypothetical protein
MGEAPCVIGCADGYFPSAPAESCLDSEIPETWVTAGYADCAALEESFRLEGGCDFDGSVEGNMVAPLGPEGTVLRDLCPVTCDDCPVPVADMDDDVWIPEDVPCGARKPPLACHVACLPQLFDLLAAEMERASLRLFIIRAWLTLPSACLLSLCVLCFVPWRASSSHG